MKKIMGLLFLLILFGLMIFYVIHDTYAKRASLRLQARYERLGIPALLEAYPARDSANIEEIESLGRQLGLFLARSGNAEETDETSPDSDYRPLNGEVLTYWQGAMTGDLQSLPPLPDDVERFLRENESIIALLVGAIALEPLTWRFEREGFNDPFFSPNLDYLSLQMILALECRRQQILGDEERAWQVYSAFWRVQSSLNDYAGAVPLMYSLSSARIAIPLLLQMSHVPNFWIKEISVFSARSAFERVYLTELHQQFRYMENEFPEESEGSRIWIRFLEPFLLAGAFRGQEVALDAYEGRGTWDWEALDSGAFEEDLRSEIPRWYIFGYLLIGNLEKKWADASRLDLSFELVRNVLEIKPEGYDETFLKENYPKASFREDLRWVVEIDESTIELRIDPDIVDPSTIPVPFRYRWDRSLL